MITFERASQLLAYDDDTGVLSWKVARSNVRAGTPVKNITTHGYLSVRIDRRRVQAHQVAWLLYYGEWPTRQIDHQDGDKTNNRISNLRLATYSQNAANSKLRADNTTGLKGVGRREAKFAAFIQVRGKQRYLGSFHSKERAAAAYAAAAKAAFGEFATSPEGRQ